MQETQEWNFGERDFCKRSREQANPEESATICSETIDAAIKILSDAVSSMRSSPPQWEGIASKLLNVVHDIRNVVELIDQSATPATQQQACGHCFGTDHQSLRPFDLSQRKGWENWCVNCADGIVWMGGGENGKTGV